MSNKVVIIISTAEKEKALTGLMYGTNALKKNWLEDVKIILFGPIEKAITEDSELQEAIKKYQEFQSPVACKLISDNEGISNNLESLGYQLDYVGTTISDYIKDGYIPMVF